MHTIKSEFKASSPMTWRRWGGKFFDPRRMPRRPKSTRPVLGYRKAHGQEH